MKIALLLLGLLLLTMPTSQQLTVNGLVGDWEGSYVSLPGNPCQLSVTISEGLLISGTYRPGNGLDGTISGKVDKQNGFQFSFRFPGRDQWGGLEGKLAQQSPTVLVGQEVKLILYRKIKGPTSSPATMNLTRSKEG